jgi:exonuclease SbcD
MRFLHTADWHLGRAFHGEPLLDAQAAMTDHLVALARDARVDAVLVAGDVYDRSLPPVDAVRLADDALRRLAGVCPVVVISGNHDSAARLGFGAGLLDRAGVHVRTVAAACGTPVELGGALIYAIPYLEPDLARAELGAPAGGHAGVLTAAMARVRADRARRSAAAPVVVMAHAFVAGGATTASERELAAGGAGAVGAGVFGGADYLALGHMHQPQRVTGGGPAGRYCGSPLAFSFSEGGVAKSAVIVDLAAAGAAPTCELVEYPVPRRLVSLRGELDALLADPAHAGAEDAWVEVTLTDARRPEGAMDRLRRRFPHAVLLQFAPDGAAGAAVGPYAERLRDLDDGAIAASFLTDVRGGHAPTDAELDLVHDALAARRVAELTA